MNFVNTYETRLNSLSREEQIEYMLDTGPYVEKYFTDTDGSSRGDIFSKYMREVEKSADHIEPTNPYNCRKCSSTMMDDDIQGCYVCTRCGMTEQMMEGDLTFKEEQELNIVGQYSYQRKNHFNEWLTQFQGLENTTVPDDIIESVKEEMRKMKKTSLSNNQIRNVLKKLGLGKYYENIPSIANTIIGRVPPKLDQADEERLRKMFSEIQTPFIKHCPSTRKNFLSYGFVLYKFCELLGLDEFLEFFPLLKSKEKLRACDSIWKGICRELSWEFIPTL